MNFRFDTADGTDSTYTSIYSEIVANTNGAPSGAMELRVLNAGVDTTAVRIKENGNVGIGTASPAAPLVVKANDTTARAIEVLGRSTDNTSLLIFYDTNGINQIAKIQADGVGGGRFLFLNNQAERMRIDENGNVGIGTTSPGALLQVQKDDTTPTTTAVLMRLVHSLSTGNPITTDTLPVRLDFMGERTDGTLGQQAAIETAWTNATIGSEDGDIQFKTVLDSSFVNAMIIKSSGNVGIGTTTPSEALHIHRATGNAGVIISGQGPRLSFNKTNANADHKRWDFTVTGANGNLFGQIVSDSGSTGTWLDVVRNSGLTTVNITIVGGLVLSTPIGANKGVGTINIIGPYYADDGSASAPAYSFNRDTDVGMYRITTDQLGFSAGGAQRLRIASTQIIANTTTFFVQNDANPPQILQFRTQNPGSGGEVARHAFDSLDSTDTQQRFAEMNVFADNVTTGNLRGSFRWKTAQGGGPFQRMRLDAGLQVGAPTGGDKGAGTINVDTDIYRDGTAYTNPDYVFELAYLNKTISPMREGYKLPNSLKEVELYTRENYHLPGMDRQAGLFTATGIIEEKIEEGYLYLFEHEKRIGKLEAENNMLKQELCSKDSTYSWC